MTSLGILQLQTQSDSHYINKISQACVNRGIKVYRFTPFNYDAKERIVHGLFYNEETREWERSSYPMPDYIYDRVFYPSDKKVRSYIQKLIHQIRKDSHFIGAGLPNKWAVYQWLKKDKYLKDHLPETNILTNETLSTFINKYKACLIKPLFGSSGNGIYVIEKKDDVISIKKGNGSSVQLVNNHIEEVVDYLEEHVRPYSYIIQPLLPLTINNRPFDLRIVMQKINASDWNVIGKGFRIGKERTFISNLYAGGGIQSTLQLPKSYITPIKENLRKILPIIPLQIQKFHRPLFELGIDIGIDTFGNVWILEVNSKPGYETVLKTTHISKKDMIFEGPVKLITNLEKHNRLLDSKKIEY
ncbi:YheC/YheD family protein [Evansella sp. AB-rgal1]|uniref:YheC/YheD family endospore coat-associated protein n=1 Tax=Evansella sp. AB-rgal1 TaxID=3242696 RepID=UPI00359CF0D0